jgi:AraC-like DNA-binding protein
VFYCEYAPSPRLRPFVERLWVLEMPAGMATVDPVLPDGHAEIIVHCGDPFREQLSNGELRTQGRVLLAAQSQRAVRLSPGGSSLIVGARLRYDGGSAMFRMPQHELTDRIVDVKTVDPHLARRLADHVAGHGSSDRDPDRHRNLAGALDEVLVSRAADGNATSLAGHAAAFAHHRRGLIRVDGLAQYAGVTERQLQRLFLRDIGLSPKQFLRTIRFQEILRALQGGTPTRWTDLALRFGFYDQAHFINDFKTFTGETPTQWHFAEDSLTAIFSAQNRR